MFSPMVAGASGALPEAIRLTEASLPFFRASATRDKISEAQIVRA